MLEIERKAAYTRTKKPSKRTDCHFRSATRGIKAKPPGTNTIRYSPVAWRRKGGADILDLTLYRRREGPSLALHRIVTSDQSPATIKRNERDPRPRGCGGEKV